MINLRFQDRTQEWKVKISCDSPSCENSTTFTLKTILPMTLTAFNRFEEKGWKRNQKIPLNRTRVEQYDLEGRPLKIGQEEGIFRGDLCLRCNKHYDLYFRKQASNTEKHKE